MIGGEGNAKAAVDPAGGGQVESMLILLSDRVAELKMRVGDLNARLAPVLLVVPPPEDVGEMVSEVMVPLAERVRREVEETEETLEALASVLRRLEL